MSLRPPCFPWIQPALPNLLRRISNAMGMTLISNAKDKLVLSRLDAQEVVRTSVLSSRWRKVDNNRIEGKVLRNIIADDIWISLVYTADLQHKKVNVKNFLGGGGEQYFVTCKQGFEVVEVIVDVKNFLQEMAENASTVFKVHVPEFVDVIRACIEGSHFGCSRKGCRSFESLSPCH